MVIADGDTHSMLNISTKYVKYMFHHQLLDGERGLSIRGLSERGKTRKPEAIDKSDCSLKFKYLVLWYLVLVLHSRRLIYRSRSIRLTFPPVSRAHKRAPPTIPVPLLFTTATAYVCARARVYVSCLPPLTSIVNIFSVFFFFPFLSFSLWEKLEGKNARVPMKLTRTRERIGHSLWWYWSGLSKSVSYFAWRGPNCSLVTPRLRQRGNVLDWITVWKRHENVSLVDT